MKKIVMASAITIATMATQLHADFSFGDMFRDMKDATTSMSHDMRDSVESMKDGAVETSKSA
ncbi:MAG: hypothetical protein U9N49_01645, partial [Campylobacterota bacterium]|nr:hypothetical protein [Campylobacterota bacterium]